MISILIILYLSIVISASPAIVNNFNATVAQNERHLPSSIIQYILGGKYVNINDYPYQVAFRYKSRYLAFCGGSIVNAHWIVTAAHCFRTKLQEIPDIEVVIGATYLGKGPGADFPISKVIMHSSYDPYLKNSPYDIALVKSPANLIIKRERFQTKSIKLSRLLSHVKPFTFGIVSGYGVDKMGKSQGEWYLKAAKIPFLPDSTCSKVYDSRFFERFRPDLEICAGFLEGGDDSCQGDSGGPLAVDIDNEKLLVGVTSSGIGCGLKNSPGRYTYIAYFADWIENTIK
jgi:secreted trypsin-like serine protease